MSEPVTEEYNANETPAQDGSPANQLHPDSQSAVDWFVTTVKQSLGTNLASVAVYGPAVTPIYDARHHMIHHLIVTQNRDVDQLLQLAQGSSRAARRGIAPPLIITEQAMQRSRDVFPLEWIDIRQFHVPIVGPPIFAGAVFDSKWVRLQCERELRSLDIQLQRGILASGGTPKGIDRLEQEASQTLLRVLRGICWLAGDHHPHLPEEICLRCEQVTELPLPGCSQAIRPQGRHDLETVRLLLNEVAQLSQWVDAHA